MATCSICKRKQTAGNNKSHSNRKTKRQIFPNIQIINGIHICTRCQRQRKKSIL